MERELIASLLLCLLGVLALAFVLRADRAAPDEKIEPPPGAPGEWSCAEH